MNPAYAAASNMQPAVDLSLEKILSSVRTELDQAKVLYESTILESPERSLLDKLIDGEELDTVPEPFRVALVEKISSHLLNGNGKWVRAALVLFCAGMKNSFTDSTRKVAIAVELVHLATLVHDDIIDEAPLRRGITTVSKGWGNAVAVLMGDLLFSKAFRLLLESESVEAQAVLTRATSQMCMGEIAELQFSFGKLISEVQYMEMIAAKTAALMAAATASGGSLITDDEILIKHFHTYGHSLGMAFQIIDDVLDFSSPTETLGKQMGVDIQNEKITLPLLHLMDSDPDSAESILQSTVPAEVKAAQLYEMMTRSGSIEYAYSVGQQYGAKARASLSVLREAFGDSPYVESMDQLIDFVLFREK